VQQPTPFTRARALDAPAGLARTLPVSSERGRVLVVEDEPKVASALRDGLEGEGYEVVIDHTGEGAFFRLNTETFAVILLDLTLPDRDGLHILTTLRERGVRTPVLVLTARDTLEDHVIGLDSGADDYLVKPFAFAELLARIRALLRRGRTSDDLGHTVGDLHLDRVTRGVTRGARPIALTLRDVWKDTARSTTLDNVIDVHIARLRRKIDLDEPVSLIHTVRGVGFTVRADEP
jgi:DNA-binding response OmpR family regulator